MEFGERNPFEADDFTPETDKGMGLFNPSQPNDFVVQMEDQTMTFLEPQPPLFPSLNPEGSPCYSDMSDSCPASPSPFSSPSPHSSASSSESGIDEGSDMEEANYAFSHITNGPLAVKMENPSSPLNALNQPPVNGNMISKKRRKSSKRSQNVLEELHNLFKETMETRVSLKSALDDHSTSQIDQNEVENSVFDEAMAGVQTTASPTPVSHSCPQHAKGSQTRTLTPNSDPVLVSSTSMVTVPKPSTPPPGASSSRIKNKNTRNPRKTDEPKIVIVEEPEENYRARYESEGCRGPIHGSQDNTFPAVKVTGYDEAVWITVHLTTSSGVPHYHSIHGPGSTKVPCRETTLPGVLPAVPAVQVMVAPDTNMTAVLDSLSIRRLRNWEGDRQLRNRGIDPRAWKKERKEARLLFQAEIPEKDGRPALKLSCKSKVFQCSSSGPPGNPEIWWASISEGSVEGGDELGLIGKKFQSGFKVRFFSVNPTGRQSVSFPL